MAAQFEDYFDKLQGIDSCPETSEQKLIEMKDFTGNLREELSFVRDALSNFAGKIEKFEESVVEWNSFLDQAEIELEICQRSSKNFEDLEENVERLQVWSVFVFDGFSVLVIIHLYVNT